MPRGGFEEVFSLDALKIFHEDELEAMLCGQGEKWTVDMLSDALKFDHGCVPRSLKQQSWKLYSAFCTHTHASNTAGPS